MRRRQLKADIGRWPRQVCFVPRQGSCTASEERLFDCSVGCRKAADQISALAVLRSMSALPPKADMCGATRDVRFGPIADMATLLFDYFVGALRKLQRHFEAYCFGSLEVDYELELTGL